MKQSLAVLALFLSVSQQTEVETRPSHLEKELESEKFQLNSLKLSYKRLENKYEALVSKVQAQGRPFAEGLGDEPVGETIRIQDTNSKSLHPVKFNQKQFAEGYEKEEPLGETIRVAESGKLQPVKFAQADEEFLKGIPDKDSLKQKIRIAHGGKLMPVQFSQSEEEFLKGIPDKDSLKQKIRIAHGGRLMPVKFNQQESQSLVQKKRKGHHFSLAGKWGPGLPEFPTNNQPLQKPYGEKQWQSWAQDHVNWLDRQTTKANTRIPYYSTLQLDSEAEKFSLAGKKGPGLPPYPANNAPLKKPRGEKQWQTWAQSLNDWSDQQTKAAQTRIPYKSTLQLDSEINIDKFSLAGKHGPGLPPYPANNAPLKKPRGEKQWQAWAQNLNDWSDQQTKAAQTRIPYKSTLQLEDDVPADLELVEMRDKEIDEADESQEDEDVQEEEDVDADIENSSDEEDDSESEEEASDDDEIEKLEMLDIPRDAKLVEAVDDDINKMESMILEDSEIPLNMRLIHLQNQDGDDIIKIYN